MGKEEIEYRSSMNYDQIKITNLIKDYLLYESDFAETELRSMVLEGEEVINAIDDTNHEFDYENEMLKEKVSKYADRIKSYHKIIRELRDTKNQRRLSENLESLIQGKEGPFIDKIKSLIKESKSE